MNKKLKTDAIYMMNCPCTNFWEIVQFNNVKVMKTWLHAGLWMRYDSALPYQIFDFSLQARCVNRKSDTVSEITIFVRMVELALIWTQITGKTIDKSVIYPVIVVKKMKGFVGSKISHGRIRDHYVCSFYLHYAIWHQQAFNFLMRISFVVSKWSQLSTV